MTGSILAGGHFPISKAISNVKAEILGYLLVLLWFYFYGIDVVGFIISISIFFYLFLEVYYIFNRRYFAFTETPSVVVFYLPVLASMTLLSFLVLQYYLRISLHYSICLLTSAIITTALVLKFSDNSGRNVQSEKIASHGSSGIYSILVLAASFFFISLAYYHFTFIGSGKFFFFGDDLGYISAIESFANGGGSLVNYGGSLVGQASFAYTSSTMTLDSFIFGLFNAGSDIVIYFILISGLFGSLFIYFNYFMSRNIKNVIVRITYIAIAIGGFSIIGVIWLLNQHNTALSFIYTPPFFQGVNFLMYNKGNIGIEQAMNDIYFKAIWHGLPYITFLQALYFLDNRSNKRLFFTYAAFTILEYYPMGLLLILSYVLYKVLNLSKLTKIRNFILVVIPAAFFIYLILSLIGFSSFSIPFIDVTVYLIPIGLLSTELENLGILIGGSLLVIYLTFDYFKQYLFNAFNVSFSVFFAVLSAFLLLTTTLILKDGIAETYLFGILMPLSMLPWLLSYLENYSNSSKSIDILEKRTNARDHIFSISKRRKAKMRWVTLAVILLITATNVSYIEQPSTNVLLINPIAGISVNSTLKEVSELMNDVIPGKQVTMVPLNLWYLGVLSNRQILTETYERPLYDYNSAVYFDQNFYVPPLDLVFNNSSSLKNLYSPPGDGAFSLVSNNSISSTPVLMDVKESYTVINFNSSLPITLSNLSMSFSIYPTAVFQQPYDILGVVITLSGGERISFQSNFPTQGNLIVVPINMTADIWNNITINFSSFSSLRNLYDQYITSISLCGGTDNVIYWKYFNLLPSNFVSAKQVISYLRNYGVTYIMTEGNNVYADELASKGSLSLIFSYSSFKLYKLLSPRSS